uniref:C2H2-type domain-containing protein n=1 Tax=Rhodosorus marinus TaxID=101924 RepID=A0A7S2ZUG9_9RHOD|mmetsp:Transcript_31327/g.120966  ORF Transcript_31327/g.120966 Transcript_31327/m.120966 type:complete len:470 (+) Transcript_31327:584-1993(+)
MEESFLNLTPYYEWDTVATNWSLFKMHKHAVPYPGDSPVVVLMDMRFRIPPATEAALSASEVARMIGVISQPSLMMTEMICDKYVLGSGWAFVGGIPSQEGRRNENFAGMQRIRYIASVQNNMGMVLITTEVRPGLIAFARCTEVDGRHNQSLWGLADQENETVLLTQTNLDRRPCNMCRTMGESCDPRTCTTEQSFEDSRRFRLSLLEKSDNTPYSIEYAVAWLGGSWTIRCDPLEPITLNTTCYLSGSNFDYALVSVLQNEISSVHPPRSSFRFVKLVRDEVDRFLHAEGTTSGGRDASLWLSEAPFLPHKGEWDQALHKAGSSMEELRLDQRCSTSSTASERFAPVPGNHRCKTCGASYAEAYELKRHWTLLHQKTRDLKCSYCDKKFKQKGHLNEHVRVMHSGKGVFPCPICRKSFGAKSKRTRHIATVHENHRGFECKVCMKKYKEKSYLKQHLRSVHGIELDS